ncbi:hypothetical protein BCR42DRAFT_410356 [Absidia repens]|uniref:Uncharacterized protein n=1 Tax=Absidia repens TaxID=90262 RepID=A0A1X2INY1_9FUNG|nr:hypothetical protein BCR42DRAFT_410356 [Absidia repens]
MTKGWTVLDLYYILIGVLIVGILLYGFLRFGQNLACILYHRNLFKSFIWYPVFLLIVMPSLHLLPHRLLLLALLLRRLLLPMQLLREVSTLRLPVCLANPCFPTIFISKPICFMVVVPILEI